MPYNKSKFQPFFTDELKSTDYHRFLKSLFTLHYALENVMIETKKTNNEHGVDILNRLKMLVYGTSQKFGVVNFHSGVELLDLVIAWCRMKFGDEMNKTSVFRIGACLADNDSLSDEMRKFRYAVAGFGHNFPIEASKREKLKTFGKPTDLAYAMNTLYEVSGFDLVFESDTDESKSTNQEQIDSSDFCLIGNIDEIGANSSETSMENGLEEVPIVTNKNKKQRKSHRCDIM
ncbi:NR LBD domain-containing protein [Caenorhabditis elegans]|uniref:NR LBD domain-containing protein n=1 Tax=Caenorhabditis elegans TaxID=6239 RepID=Q9XWS5_CAEEL|nr:NR LBD domain-containing protein [Caenorhabditis elegans]CAA21570.2 NR LBD domain-containing protein [Caenorhabditis elegans]|eukprot:NP_509992.2 Uncharacterized protein CELE_Y62H9A.11 [Caenorhabditis elegans]